jgi:hypothetical protein
MDTSVPPSETLITLAGRLISQVAVYALMRRLDAPRWAALAAASATGHLANADPRPKLTAEDVAQTMIDRLARDAADADETPPTIVADPITMRRDDAHRALVELGWTNEALLDALGFRPGA